MAFELRYFETLYIYAKFHFDIEILIVERTSMTLYVAES